MADARDERPSVRHIAPSRCNRKPFAYSKRAQPAVDYEIGAGHIAAVLGSQEQRHGSDLFGAAKASLSSD
jgi:hypothetical protein